MEAALPIDPPKKSKLAKAMREQPPSPDYPHARVFSIDWRSLERNKYAPWGCGSSSGLEGRASIQSYNR
jgi:hypothetical protein